jgi:hypothetical protein
LCSDGHFASFGLAERRSWIVSDGQRLKDVGEAVLRIEERQAAYQQVAHRILGVLQVHNEKLDAILEAAVGEPGPSPVQALLGEILESMRAQEHLLRELPTSLAEIMREEDHELESEWEPADAEPSKDQSDRHG